MMDENLETMKALAVGMEAMNEINQQIASEVMKQEEKLIKVDY